VARVALLTSDLLFGSKVEGALRAAGHEVVLGGRPHGGLRCEVAVVDLTEGDVPDKPGVPTVGYYLHTDQDTRERAEAAGYDLVVPRSRMNREGPQLVERLLAP
jgi:hypothetical protein